MSSISPLTAAEMREKIYAKQPVFAQVMREHGQETLYTYVQRLFESRPSFCGERRARAIDVIHNLVAERLGSELAGEVRTQLTEFPILSTTDHHSWLQDPFWVNANLLQAFGIQASHNPSLKHCVVLSFSSISLNNRDGYPRGMVVHDSSGQKLLHPALFPNQLKHQCVYAAPAASARDIEHWLHNVHTLTKQNMLQRHQAESLEQLVVSSFDETVLGTDSLAEQITVFNARQWQRLFDTSSELVYIEIETVVRELLLQEFENPDALLTRIFFDSTLHARMAQVCAGARGGFALDGSSGSYFFWGINSTYERVPIFVESGVLRSRDGSIRVSWSAEAITEALTAKRIMPGMMLCYMVMALYYGFTCLGGFCQIQDLTVIKEMWLRVMVETGELVAMRAAESIYTAAFIGDVALPRLPSGRPATAWDMLIGSMPRDLEWYASMARAVTLEKAIEPMLPDMYSVVE